MTNIQFHSGLTTVGGNIVSIIHGNHRIITDFGALIGQAPEANDSIQSTQDLYYSHLLPHIEGVYRGDFDFSFQEDSLETIILISHLHLDHIGSLGHLHSAIPVFMSQESLDFYELLSQHELLPKYSVNFMGVDYYETIEFGPFNIYFVPSDHDTRGISSIFIQSPDHKIIYSGDLRLSGYYPQKVHRMVSEAYDFQADLLLLEGTSYSGFGENPSPLDIALDPLVTQWHAPSERALVRNIESIFAENSDQVIAFNGYPQNIDRVIDLASRLQVKGRQCVLQDNFYQVIQPYSSADLFLPLSQVDFNQIAKHPGGYWLQIDELSYRNLFQLPAGILLHSNGSPLGSYMEGYEEYIRSIHSHGWKIYLMGTSGHASQGDLLSLAYGIQAKYTVPWHTANSPAYAEALKEYGISTWLPELGRVYALDEVLKSGDLDG